jgi:hypothetical protein
MPARLTEAMAQAPFVLVTVAPNGVKHAWGPFASPGEARRHKRRFAREEPDVFIYVLKVLPIAPPEGWGSADA